MPSSIQVANMVLSAIEMIHLHTAHSIGAKAEEQFGWTVLGSGQNGVAIVHPYDRNLVVKIIHDVEDGGMDVAAWIVRHQMQGLTSKYLPEILALQVKGKRAAVVMERLDPLRKDEVKQPEGWFYGRSECRVLQKFFDECGRPNDLHDGNWMLRGDTPVLIDPIYARPDKKHCWSTYWRDGKVHVHAQHEVEPSAMERMDKAWNEHAAGLARMHDRLPVHNRLVQAGQNAQQVRKLEPMKIDRHMLVNMDFAELEKRAMAHMFARPSPIKKVLDHIRPDGQRVYRAAPIKLRGFRPDMIIADDLWPPHVGGHVFVDKRAYAERTAVVKDGSPASIRREKEDRMLRIRSQHDNQPRTQGVQRPLFPGRKPRRVPAAWATFVSRVVGAEGGVG